MGTLVFAARQKNRDKLVKSSSGGMFDALSDVFLEKGNCVVSAIYSYEKKQVEFQLIIDKETRDKASGSKYMQSIPGNVFKNAVEWMKNNPNKKLLFLGMGCQTAAFGKYVELVGVKERVTLVDIICHGSPSPMIWREYAERIEEESGKIESLTFKDKRVDWNHPISVARIGDKEIFLNDYVKVFYNRCALRPACHKCPYTRIKRNTDLTIGDFWGIDKVMPEFYDEMGNSLVLVHSEKGQKIFDQCKSSLEYKESNERECIQPNLIRPTAASEERSAFWQDYYEHGNAYVMKKYGHTTWWQKLKRKVKNLLK